MMDPHATGVWPPAELVPAEWPTIPGYEILEELGRGGMGVVYKARQASANRLVALKLIRDSALAGPQERARFRIEAEAAARMRHANIVQIYEVGEHLGRPYFAMELLEGGSLDKHIAGRMLSAAQAAQLVCTLAHAVQHAHEQKIVHRDLKPANVLLGMENGELRMENKPVGSFSILHSPFSIPKVTDFGLAKRLDSQSTALTNTGAVLGTVDYMAPEQAAGRTHAIGSAVDIYALGAILYELLTGRPPFHADTWNQTIEQVLWDEPVPPTQRSAAIPKDLESVCLKCLEKAPERRYATAQELADDLGRFLNSQPVAAVPLNARERLSRLAARDGYQLGDEIGRGPRSTVYRALYGPLQQPVAVKVFDTGICSQEEWTARFETGASLWAALSHPHILVVQRAGWWEGAPFVVTDYVPTGSLAAKLTGQPYPVLAALRLVEQLAEIVMYLHRQGVVHANLKPSNVLLAADGIPRVGDFRATGGLFQGPLTLDEPQVSGLGYLAPEFIQDPTVQLHPHTDIYSLGVILYELLTGRRPFEGATTQETLEQVRSRDVEPPSRFNPDVTPQLDGCCFRCLRKNPWRRYHRAYDLISRLRYFQENPDSAISSP
jgi:serine/threonine protein kinase